MAYTNIAKGGGEVVYGTRVFGAEREDESEDESPTSPGEPDDDSVTAAKGPPMGTLIDGAYRLVSPLGHGGMGIVLLARDEILDRDVALKLIRPELLGNGVRDRFLTEARAMARVNHPNVLQIHAFGQHDRAPYIVMEFVDGQTVEAWLRKTKLAGALPDIDASIRILERTCLGVQAIHDAHTVHRDLKPSNILLDANLRVRVADLGLANLVRAQSAGQREIVGTPSYMAPEVALDQDVPHDLVARADVYSLACIAYEMFTGRVPFKGPTVLATFLEHALTPAVAPSELRPDLNPQLDAVILRALAKDPAERTPSAEAFRRELVAARDGTREPVRILLADDNREFREVLETALSEEFPLAEIEAVADGAQALRAFDARRHSAVIIDLRMPCLDGLELTGLLRARDTASKVPIIVLTSEGGPTEWKRLSAMGADGFLLKPVNLVDVVTLLRRALGDRSRSFPPAKPAYPRA